MKKGIAAVLSSVAVIIEEEIEMSKRVMPDNEFWQLFKYDICPPWTANWERDLYGGDICLIGKAEEWFAREISAFNMAKMSQDVRCTVEASLLESGESMGLISWSQVDGARHYQATKRLEKAWEHLYPYDDPDEQFAIDPAKPVSIVLLDGWMYSFITQVHRAAAIDHDFEPGRLMLNYKFSILTQLEAAGWVEVRRGPKEAAGLTFSSKSIEAMRCVGALPGRKIENYLCRKSNVFGYNDSVLSCLRQPPVISISSASQSLSCLGTLMGFSHLGLLKQKVAHFELVSFEITKSGEQAGLGIAGSEYPYNLVA